MKSRIHDIAYYDSDEAAFGHSIWKRIKSDFSCLFVLFRGSGFKARNWNHEITQKDTKQVDWIVLSYFKLVQYLIIEYSHRSFLNKPEFSGQGGPAFRFQ